MQSEGGWIGSMTFEEFKVLAKAMKAVYVTDKFLPDADALRVWYQMLKDLDYLPTQAAIQKYMATNKFPPTIAEIRASVNQVQTGETPDWGSGWYEVNRAIRRYGYCREAEALNMLPPLARAAAERIGWKDICMSENPEAIRAQFRQVYESMSKRETERLQIPPALRETIQGLMAFDGPRQLGGGT